MPLPAALPLATFPDIGVPGKAPHGRGEPPSASAAKTVIEVDGATHDAGQDADARRDAFMESLGLKVMRVAAADVLADPEAVADAIYRLCDARVGPSTTQPGG